MKTIKQSLLITLSITIFIAGYVWAGEVPILKIFEKGTPAVAKQVNDNFDSVKKEVNDNNERITANASNINSKQNRITGSCSEGYSIRAVAADGSVTCEKDDQSEGGITDVIAGDYLSAEITEGEVTLDVVGMPGVEYSYNPGSTSITTKSQRIHAISLGTPSSGYIICSFSGNVRIDEAESIRFWQDNCSASDPDANFDHPSFRFIAVIGTPDDANFYQTISSDWVIPVKSAQTVDICLFVDTQFEGYAGADISESTITAIFVPNRY